MGNHNLIRLRVCLIFVQPPMTVEISLLSHTLYPVGMSLLWDTVILTENDDDPLTMFMQKYGANRQRDFMDPAFKCNRLAIAPYCIAPWVGVDTALLLANDIILHLRPQELSWECGDIPAYKIKTYPPYLAPSLFKLTVEVVVGTDFLQLADLLSVSPLTLQQLIVVTAPPLYQPPSPGELQGGWATRLWEEADEAGYEICSLPALKHLFLISNWTDDEYQKGETITMQNLLQSIDDDCIVQVRDRTAHFINLPPWVPVWQERLNANRSIPLEEGMTPQEGVKYYIPIA